MPPEESGGLIGRILCGLGRHDWEEVDNFEAEYGGETEEGLVYHYDMVFPLRWECTRCDEFQEHQATKITAVDPDGGIISSRELSSDE